MDLDVPELVAALVDEGADLLETYLRRSRRATGRIGTNENTTAIVWAIAAPAWGVAFIAAAELRLRAVDAGQQA